jgi:hypothetical protein
MRGMKKNCRFSVWLLLICLTLGFHSYRAQSPNTDALFDTVFVDEFSTINANNWGTHYPWGDFWNTNISTYPLSIAVGGTICNNTTYFIQPGKIAGLNYDINDTNNFQLGSGGGLNYIRLTGKKESTPKNMTKWKQWYSCSGTPHPNCTAPCWGSACVRDTTMPFKYTNGMLASKRTFKYGYIEMKFRIPEFNNPSYTLNTYHSSGPTFWMLGNIPSQPYSELDIYEGMANNCQYTNNWHVVTTNGGRHNDNPYPENGGTHNLNYGQWHTVGVNWTPTYLDFYLDDNLIRRQDRDSVSQLDTMYLYIENIIPNTENCFSIDSVNTPFPIHYDIDYVKVWNPKLDCSTDKVYTNVTQASYDPKIYKSLLISGSGYSATFTSGFTHFASNNGIELREGFEVSSNGTALLETLPCFSGMTHALKAQPSYPAPSNVRMMH